MGILWVYPSLFLVEVNIIQYYPVYEEQRSCKFMYEIYVDVYMYIYACVYK